MPVQNGLLTRESACERLATKLRTVLSQKIPCSKKWAFGISLRKGWVGIGWIVETWNVSMVLSILPCSNRRGRCVHMESNPSTRDCPKSMCFQLIAQVTELRHDHNSLLVITHIALVSGRQRFRRRINTTVCGMLNKDGHKYLPFSFVKEWNKSTKRKASTQPLIRWAEVAGCLISDFLSTSFSRPFVASTIGASHGR